MRWSAAVWFWAGLSVVPAFGIDRPLDLYINTIQLGPRTEREETSRSPEIRPDKPLGQTFFVPSDADTIHRIGFGQAFFDPSWDQDEVLVATLWDSPRRKVSYGRARIPYQQRMWEKAFPMPILEARVQPGRSYYFELTVGPLPDTPSRTHEEWILTKKPPGFSGCDGRLGGIGSAKDDYPDGRAYVGGEPQEFDLFFEVHTRRIVDRDKLHSRVFDYFDLDYEPLAAVRKAVEARDWDRAVTEMIKHFESREDLVKPRRPVSVCDLEYDTRDADLASIQKVYVPEDGTIVDLSPHWNYYALWPQRGGVGLTRDGLRKPLAVGYEHTDNPEVCPGLQRYAGRLFRELPVAAPGGRLRPR